MAISTESARWRRSQIAETVASSHVSAPSYRPNSIQWYLACDEKRVFRRKAIEILGEDRLLTTPGIIVLCIRQGLITIDEADRLKAILETKRFKMAFGSFREVV
jgi:hypothetical protein